jgi:ATP-dependent phosphofructokinase / diphosphate-dependent phosphofructokinase
MGRDAGWLAAAALLARDAPGAPPHAIHLPEAPPDRRTFLDGVEQALADDGFALVVVSEGLHWKDGSPIVPVLEEQNDAMGRPLPGDVASHLAALASRELGVRARSEKPGLLGRCSLASSSDRRDALAVGAAAVSAACAGHTRVMVSLSRAADGTAQTRLVPLAEAAGRHRPFPGEWISNDDISPRFAEYLAPLIEEPPPGRFTLPPLSP